jgi:hypothetical protein
MTRSGSGGGGVRRTRRPAHPDGRAGAGAAAPAGWLTVVVVASALLAACSASPSDVGPGSSAPHPRSNARGFGTGAPGLAPTAPLTLPADLTPPPAATCSPDLALGWLRRENSRPGTVVVRAAPPEGIDHLYLDAVSTVCGQAVHVAVSAQPGRYRLDAVRLGWYGGAGGRLVAHTGEFTAGSQPDEPAVAQGLSPGWAARQVLHVGPGWPPGVYLVQLISGTRIVSTAPLVIRAPQTARRSAVLFVASAMTWTAYTDYGGISLYRTRRGTHRIAVADRARLVDVARPTTGPGLASVYRYTTSLVRAVERAGVDVDYAADLDVDRLPSLVTARAELVTGAHSEYVTQRVYDAFEVARDAGTNLAFLGGNAFYWQARVERDGAANPLSMTVYRRASEDPLTATRPGLSSVRWRQWPVSRPEAGLLGAQYSGLGVVAPLVVLDPPPWLGWKRGSILAAGAASEVDALVPGVSPAGTQVIAAGAGTVQGREIHATVTYYVASSGAGVFDASNVFVGCSTDNSCGTVNVPAHTGRSWLDAIGRVVTAFASPRFGRTHPSHGAGLVPSAAQLLAAYGPAARGSAVHADD